MLEKILSSKSKVKILRILNENPEREFCLDDIVKHTSSSFGTISPSIRNLVSLRIVVTRKIGRTKLYKINKRNPIYPKLSELFKKEKTMLFDIAREFVSELDKENIRAIVLFGSVARGEMTEKSDIDLLLIMENTRRIKHRVNRLTQRFLEKYDAEIMPVYITQKEFKNKKAKLDRFITNIIKEGKILFGTIGD